MQKIMDVTILIIDDDPTSVKLIEHILERAAYKKINTALSAQEGIDSISKYPPDVILLDIVMPKMSGLRLCKKLKSDAATRDIPVIMITGVGVNLDRTIARAFKAGASDYITKPIHAAEFLARFKAVVRFKQSNDRVKKELDRRKKAEEALRKSRSVLQTVFQAAPVGIAIVNNRIMQTVNKRMCTLSGYEEQELVNHNTQKFYENEEEFLRVGVELYEGIWEHGMKSVQTRLLRKDGVQRDAILTAAPFDCTNHSAGVVIIADDITDRKRSETEREKLIGELRAALHNIKTLKKLLPICASCKKIRDDQGYWDEVEKYIETYTDTKFSHGICPQCMKKLYPDMCNDE